MPLARVATLVPLLEVRSAEHAGAKAFRLAQLDRAGVRVPETLVLPAGANELPDGDVLEALGGCLAVRSSATVEDADKASFAGQFESVLNVRTREDLARAIHQVRASAGSEAVQAYCAARGVDPATIRMAVILQRMVQAQSGGVIFTINPVSGCERDMLIEACPGPAVDLLAGRSTGVRIPIRDGRPVGLSEHLSSEQVLELVATGRRIERLYGCPQDIEWAFEEGRLYVLQARPVTRLCFGGIEGEWTNADFRDGGVASDVVTPFMWSLYELTWDRALKGFLRELRLLERDFPAARVFYGRPYWNLEAVKRCARKLPGFIEGEFDRDLGIQPASSASASLTPAGFWYTLKALPTLLATASLLRRQAARDRRLLAMDWLKEFDADLRLLDNRDLTRRFQRLVESAYRACEENYFRTIFCLSIAKMDFKRAASDLPVSYCSLVGGLGGLKHIECAQALWGLANAPGGNGLSGATGCRALARFLTQYGHHSQRELDLRVPRWSEDPEFMAALVRKLIGSERPAEAIRRPRQEYRDELARACKLLSPWRRHRFEKKLTQLRNYLWLREQMRDLSTRVYARLRRYVLEVGRRAVSAGRLRSAEDVFYLSFREIYELFNGCYAAVVLTRKDEERRFCNFSPPTEVGRRFVPAPEERGGQRLTGIGCSAGVATGRVRVVRTFADAGKLQVGDILVCPFTDPGWTPLLNLAAGVVTENGGLLSHAAVICRECAIPAVLNVAGATHRLRDDQVVRADGDRGYVDIL
jgi:pyruvate,water dikinase